MNKQELIEKIKKAIKDELSGNYYRKVNVYGDGDEDYAEEDAQNVANDIILDLEEDLKQLDEPQKPVVPKFVADWIFYAKDKGWNFAQSVRETESETGDVLVTDWYDAHSSIYARAWLDGYEVEKEPLYIMPVPHLSFPVHYCVEDDHISFRQGNAQKFTQAELDKYFPDIKQFAVPVNEVVEG